MLRINLFRKKLSPEEYIQKYNSGTENINNYCLESAQATKFLVETLTQLKTYSYREQIDFLLEHARKYCYFEFGQRIKDTLLVTDAIKAQVKYLIFSNSSKPTSANFNQLLTLENFLTKICDLSQPDYQLINIFLEHKQGPITIMALKELIYLIGDYYPDLYYHLQNNVKINQIPREDICQIFKTLASSQQIEHAIETPDFRPFFTGMTKCLEIYHQIAETITNRVELERKQQQVRAFVLLGLFQDKLPMEMQLEIVEHVKPSVKGPN
jgi:hypothetical protein